MGFLGVFTALYDYTPQNENELEIKEGELLYILETTNDQGEEDDWWKARKKAASDDEDEPEGLVPATYVEQVGRQLASRFIPRLASRTSTLTPLGETRIPGQIALRIRPTD